MARMHSYVVARDYGFAPNPFFGVCTLATCKPRIRKAAEIDDWVIGTGSKTRGREGRLVYAMRVTATMSLDDYWKHPEYQVKKPVLSGSKKQAFGDNIYHRDPKTKRWIQVNSHHSLPNGKPNKVNVETDTQTDRILLSKDFVYWGGNGPMLPKTFRQYGGKDLCGGRGHKNRFSEQMIEEFVLWLRSLQQQGYCGSPLDWAKTP